MTREDVLREFVGERLWTPEERDLAGEIVRLRERVEKARNVSYSGTVWSLVRKTLSRVKIATAPATTYEHESAQLDEMARQCEADILDALGGDDE